MCTCSLVLACCHDCAKTCVSSLILPPFLVLDHILFNININSENFFHCFDMADWVRHVAYKSCSRNEVVVVVGVPSSSGSKRACCFWVKWKCIVFIQMLYHLFALPVFHCVRKHTLNCHRMKPALFQVLCEIKEKTGKTVCIYICTKQWTCHVFV